MRIFMFLSMLLSLLSPGALLANSIANSGWWWNPAEGGRGFTIEQQGNNIFMAGFLYDVAGRATWYSAGPTPISSTTFTSTLTEYSGGQSLTGAYRAPTSTRNIGNISIRFTDQNHGIVTWPGGTIPIQRFDFGPGGSGAARPVGTPETGWWWNAGEGGRGFSIEIQGGTMFLGGYMYDARGNPTWYTSGPMAAINATTYRGTWNEYGNGQTLAGLFQPASIVNANVGPVTVQFTSATTAMITLPDGRPLSLSRFSFEPTTTPQQGGLFVGYYQEDPIDNPEDPSIGAIYLNLPNGDSNFSGNMFFTFFGCQTSNVGTVSGNKTAQTLAGNWAGTIDGSPQSGTVNAVFGNNGNFYSGTYTNSRGKQFRDLSPCIRYTLASRGTVELFPVGENFPGTFSVSVNGNRVVWPQVNGASIVNVSILDATVAATPGSGNAITQQLLFGSTSSSADLLGLNLVRGRQYIATVAITNSNFQRIAFGSTQFIAP